MEPTHRVSLTSHWYIKAGKEAEVLAAIHDVVPKIQACEPGTLTYLVHRPFTGDDRLITMPPGSASLLLFFEEYANPDAFETHVNGPYFTDFVEKSGDLFEQMGGKPFASVTFLSRQAGFIRGSAEPASDNLSTAAQNQHPSVMFEIISQDQAASKAFYNSVFDWEYQSGTDNFAYIHFPAGSPQLLGGIGEFKDKIPGFEPGTNFYLRVEDLQVCLDRAVKAGGTILMEPTEVDGYHFGMFRDPEGFAVGLITPFEY